MFRCVSRSASLSSPRLGRPSRGLASGGKTIGFIGLGNMGAKMASNLITKGGYSLVVHDLNQAAVKELVSKGAKEASSPSQVAEQVDYLVTMLPSSPHVKEVYLNPAKGIISTLKAGSLCIDASTIDPATARQVASKLGEKKITMIDAPVSGGVGGAEAGTLTFMVGATAQDFERAKPMLQFMGKNIVHCGGSGTGQVAKICNNLVLAISMSGVSEAMNLGVKLGIDPKVLAGIFNTSSARCWSSDTYNPVPGVMPNVPSSRGYSGGFQSDLMLKDVGLAIDAAKALSSVPTPLGDAAKKLYEEMSKAGYGKKDFSSAYEYLSKKK